MLLYAEIYLFESQFAEIVQSDSRPALPPGVQGCVQPEHGAFDRGVEFEQQSD